MGNEKSGGKFREFALAFLKEAKEDLETSEELMEKKRYSRVVYFAQQCVEKTIKALLEMEKVYVAEHDLSAFFVKFLYNNNDYTSFKEEMNEILSILNYFEGEWSKTRYPKEKEGKVVTPTEIYDYNTAIEAIEKAKRVFISVRKVLSEKFNLVL